LHLCLWKEANSATNHAVYSGDQVFRGTL